LDTSFIQKIYELAENKTTSEMRSRKMISKINEELKTNNILDINKKPIKISNVTAYSYMNQLSGRPRRIRRVFYLTKEKNEKKG